MTMKQESYLKSGLLRLLTILIPLLALFSALILISSHTPLPSKKKDLLCPFMLIVLPSLKNTVESSFNRLNGKTKILPDDPPHFRTVIPSTPALNEEADTKPNKTHEKKSIPRPENLHREKVSTSPWLQDSQFFQAVRSDFNTENYPSLELLFYLHLYPTKDKRWLVSKAPLSSSQIATMRQPPQAPPSSKKLPNPYPPSSFTLEEIQKQFSSHLPLTLRDLLDQFPKQKWFFHLMTQNPQDSFESLIDQQETLSLFYITSNNEKLLKQLSEKQMRVIYNFRSLLRFQLLRVFLLEKLFSFPGQGLIIPSTLPLSSTTVERLRHSGQWLFLKKETSISDLPPQSLKQVKGLITREWKPALKWLQDKNPCLQEN